MEECAIYQKYNMTEYKTKKIAWFVYNESDQRCTDICSFYNALKLYWSNQFINIFCWYHLTNASKKIIGIFWDKGVSDEITSSSNAKMVYLIPNYIANWIWGRVCT